MFKKIGLSKIFIIFLLGFIPGQAVFDPTISVFDLYKSWNLANF